MIEKWDSFPLLYLKDVLILLRQFHMVIVYAPVAQGIEHRPPEAGAAVRIRPGVYAENEYITFRREMSVKDTI